ncbi:hypothetical protein SEA_STIGMA_45 [Streptomyces phage Stigma]|nr:hypothetical protein SEA_STIGMA_45 [Streptomyces phage Stigma]
MNEMKKLQLTNTALKQSLANKVANYEDELANIRAEASILLEEQGEKISELEQTSADKDAKIESLEQRVRELEGESADVAVSS